MNEQVKIWYERAEKDLRAAEKNLDIEEEEVALFLLHQALEKALKALQIKQTGDHKLTHDLQFLYNDVEGPEEFRDLVEELNPVYTASRYPDVGEFLDVENADAYTGRTTELLTWIKKQLQK